MKYLIYKVIKVTFLLTIGILISSCSSSINKEDLQYLTGYWQIDEMTIGDETKQFPSSNQADYIFLDLSTMKGFRKKLTQYIDGNYNQSNHQESLHIIEREGSFHIVYDEDERTEEIITLKKDQLVLSNPDGMVYYYIPFKSIETIK